LHTVRRVTDSDAGASLPPSPPGSDSPPAFSSKVVTVYDTDA
jgi:hypothetical protein